MKDEALIQQIIREGKRFDLNPPGTPQYQAFYSYFILEDKAVVFYKATDSLGFMECAGKYCLMSLEEARGHYRAKKAIIN